MMDRRPDECIECLAILHDWESKVCDDCVEARARHDWLVVLDPDHCPVDGSELLHDGMSEPALFKHGGYGATRLTAVRYCQRCGWSITREVSEISPRRDA